MNLAPKLVVLFLLLAIMPGSSNVEVRLLEPGWVIVPDHIRTVMILDRTPVGLPAQAGEGAAFEDQERLQKMAAVGRSEALRALSATLGASPRFEVVMAPDDLRELEPSLFEPEMNHPSAARVCRRAGCQGIIALEAFDFDSAYEESKATVNEVDANGQGRERTIHRIQRITTVQDAWRFYDPQNQTVINEQQLRPQQGKFHKSEGDSPEEARGYVDNNLHVEVNKYAYAAGESYGRHVAPTWVTVKRPFFSSGPDALKEAKPLVKAGEWERAAELWRPLTESKKSRERGKAWYNLALTAEVAGDLEEAWRCIGKAAQAMKTHTQVLEYEEILRKRRQKQEYLRKQAQEPSSP